MENTHYISSKTIDIHDIRSVLKEHKKIALSDGARQNIQETRDYRDEKMNNSDEPFYGINTGFGSLCNVKISKEKLTQLQENLVMSHACGTGDRINRDIVKLMLLLKVQSLSYGHSGVTIEVVQRLIDFFNKDVLPVVYEQGSLGASGDLAPLAHLALPLLGKGLVYHDGQIKKTSTVLDQMDWKPLNLRSKEGLALLNGTQFMSAHAVYALMETFKLSYLADAVSAVSMDAYDC